MLHTTMAPAYCCSTFVCTSVVVQIAGPAFAVLHVAEWPVLRHLQDPALTLIHALNPDRTLWAVRRAAGCRVAEAPASRPSE